MDERSLGEVICETGKDLDDDFTSSSDALEHEIKLIIREMIRAQPQARLSAFQVLEKLTDVMRVAFVRAGLRNLSVTAATDATTGKKQS